MKYSKSTHQCPETNKMDKLPIIIMMFAMLRNKKLSTYYAVNVIILELSINMFKKTSTYLKRS